ncbi:hypothetical protein FCULG_00003551 [Fusarium culmorum]|uniref:Uncharacterized protein n=1 Tax=Fusarium culmorum TaxID=5516 RepID=A0A2T4HAY4_FUSCU|nr:hypothetical protein FCULG_00003551 [Fusarium culmorum]
MVHLWQVDVNEAIIFSGRHPAPRTFQSKYRVAAASTSVAKGWQLDPLGRDKVKCLVRLADSTRPQLAH